MKRRRGTILVTIAGLVMLAGCGSNKGSSEQSLPPARSSGPLSVSFANATNVVPIFQQVGAGVERAAGQAGIALKSYDNNSDGATALDNARLMVQDKPDPIIEYNLVQDSGNAISKVLTDARVWTSARFGPPWSRQRVPATESLATGR